MVVLFRNMRSLLIKSFAQQMAVFLVFSSTQTLIRQGQMFLTVKKCILCPLGVIPTMSSECFDDRLVMLSTAASILTQPVLSYHDTL